MISRDIVSARPSPIPAELRVIVPNRRAAAVLQVPAISLEDLAQRQLRSHNLHPVSAFEAWRSLHLLPKPELLQAWPTDKLLSEIRTVLQVPLEEWQQRADSLSDRLQALVDLTAAYQTALRAQGRYDPAERFRLAAALGQPEPLLLWGYWDSQPEQLACINQLAGEGSILVLPYTELLQQQHQLEQLAAWGWQIKLEERSPEPWLQQWIAPNPPKIAEPIAHSYRDREQEVRSVLGHVKQLLQQNVAQSDIALLAADDRAYGPLVQQIGWEYGLPTRMLYEIAISETRLGRWLEDLLTAIAADFDYPSGIRVFSPSFCAALPDGRQRQLRRDRPQNLAAWQTSLATEFSPWPLAATRTEWVGQLRQWLQQLGLRQGLRRWPQDLVALNRLQQQLKNLAEPASETLTRQQWCQEFEQLIRISRTPVQPGRGGVQLDRPEQIVGAQIGHVFYLGLNEGVWPAPLASSSLIDYSDRRQLQRLGLPLPTAASLVQQAKVQWIGALAATQTAQFSWVRQHDNREQLPSAYLEQMGLRSQITPAADSPHSPEEYRRRLLAQSTLVDDGDPIAHSAQQRSQQVQARLQGEAVWNGQLADSISIPTRPLSVTGIIQLGQCPYRWAASKLLNLQTDSERSDDPDAAMTGTLLHKALELLTPQLKTETLPDREILLAIVETAAAHLAKQRPREGDLRQHPRWTAFQLSYVNLPERLLRSPNFRSPDSEIIAVEQSFEGQWQGLPVRGTIDRIDRTSAGLELIDYKLGSTTQKVWDTDQKLKLDLQLALYQEVGAAAIAPDQPVAQVRYLHMRKAEASQPKPAEATELEQLAARLKQAFEGGHFPIRPHDSYCRYCDFAGLCRHSELKQEVDHEAD
ncbi:hypothetical protein syc0394_c [Synechococcus elongatus PCC 6301]|uniref:PD-(D/E)XK endonuclease-like domain-containing protein n=1 Tax=Synechococcus sp. (strain ATCC 27144 / PCC 6301 / SAUG 1402/1) TaxID=269084 RepID=A0A0H3K366_SYNP6|nr:PD-(D/E)XK nuclease family protein [Synechococcus elongatus]BAD78584.1 hypothetical protein syc0394_c [Synechococcus elongatus PCC 6301]